MKDAVRHTPVLLNEVLAVLSPKRGEFFADGTLNGGGHARAIMTYLGREGIFLGIDLDSRMIEGFKASLTDIEDCPQIILETNNFKNLSSIIERHELPKPQGLLLDLGFSSRQLQEDSGIGISFLGDEPLRMTYSREAKPVSELLNEISEKELADLILRYSGEKNASRIALEIKRSLPIRTTRELREAVERAVPGGYEHGRIHKATRTFQALRIFANEEIENLETILNDLPRIMSSHGRVLIITFHSLEDAIVKKAFKSFVSQGKAELLTKKPIVVSHAERQVNPRARSAKLRSIKFF